MIYNIEPQTVQHYDIESQTVQHKACCLDEPQDRKNEILQKVFCPRFQCGHTVIIVPGLYFILLALVGLIVWLIVQQF